MKSLSSLFSKSSIVDRTERKSKILILTGAGISAPSGISTFRNDPDSFWVKFDPDVVCHADTRNDKAHFDFINTFKEKLKNSSPNEAHNLISKYQRLFGSERVVVYTTNIDDLHQMTGTRVVHLHGQIRYVKCENKNCKYRADLGLEKLEMATRCPLGCGVNSNLRTQVVLFGETLGKEYEMILNDIENLREGDLFLSIGSSFSIFPFHEVVHDKKCRKVNVTLDQDQKTNNCFDKVYVNNVIETLSELENEFKNILS